MGKQWKQWHTLLSWAPNAVDSDCSHEIKRCLLLGRKTMTNLDIMLKRRDITLPTKVCIVKAIDFPVVMCGCESWTIRKVECWRDAFELWYWRRLLRVPWTARIWNQSLLREIISHWKDWCWSWSFNTQATSCKELTHWKRPQCWERLKAGGEGDNRGWEHYVASLTQWTWVWANSGRWLRTGKPGVLKSMGSQSWTQWSNWTTTTIGYLHKRNVNLNLHKNLCMKFYSCIVQNSQKAGEKLNCSSTDG